MLVSDVIRRAGRLFGDSNNILISAADFYDFINEAQTRIAQETDCLLTSVSSAASTYPKTLASDFMKVDRVLYGTKALDKINPEDLDALKLDATITGTPQFYYVFNGTLCLYPDATSTDTTTTPYYYTKTPTLVTAGSDALTVPLHMQEAVVTLVVMRCHERNENWRAAERYETQYLGLTGVRTDASQNPDDSYPVVRDDPFDWSFG